MIHASTLHIVIAVAAVIVVAIVAYYGARMMKGKIEIQMTRSGFNSGEAVTGSIVLSTKKALDVRRVFVALIGYEVTERRQSDGDRRTERREIFRDEKNLEEPQILPAGFHKNYDFALTAPGKDTVGTAQGGGLAISIGALTIGGDRSRRLEWKVEARADLPGVDIAKSQTVRINVA